MKLSELVEHPSVNEWLQTLVADSEITLLGSPQWETCSVNSGKYVSHIKILYLYSFLELQAFVVDEFQYAPFSSIP